jgi:hypothetical protein
MPRRPWNAAGGHQAQIGRTSAPAFVIPERGTPAPRQDGQRRQVLYRHHRPGLEATHLTGGCGLGHHGASILPSTFTTVSAPTMSNFRGSMTRPGHSLCTLRSPLPRVHATLGSGCWPTLPGGSLARWVPAKGFRHAVLTCLSPFPDFAWRTIKLHQSGRYPIKTRSPHPGVAMSGPT